MDSRGKEIKMPGISSARFVLVIFLVLMMGAAQSSQALQTLPEKPVITPKTTPAPLKSVSTITSLSNIRLPQGTVKRFYSCQLPAKGEKPFVFKLKSGSLPKGLTLGRTGIISGSPVMEGSFSFSVTISDAKKQTVVQNLLLTITPWPLSPDVKKALPIERKVFPVAEAQPSLEIVDVFLFFENFNSGITVKNHKKGLKVYAAIRFKGMGWIDGVWKVNDKTLSRVKEYLDPGRVNKAIGIPLPPDPSVAQGSAVKAPVSLKSGFPQGTITRGPVIPSLGDDSHREDIKKALTSKDTWVIASPELPLDPIADKGGYTIQFVISGPRQKQLVARAAYDVPIGDQTEKATIRLVFPEDNAALDDPPALFSWDGLEGASTYTIEVFDQESKKALFSDETRAAKYAFGPRERKDLFSTAGEYLWKVSGYDKNGNIKGMSGEFQFTILPSPDHVPGQILVVLRSGHAERVVKDLALKYNLRLIKTDSIRTIRRTMAVLSTDKDIYTVIKALEKERGVVAAQPNNIFRTMSEPMSDLQKIHSVCNLDKIHRRYTGRHVTVGIVDTGVDTHHQDLNKRVAFHENFVENSPYRGEIHGTAVAGIIGADLNDFGISGLAPGVEILALRACQQVSEKHPEGRCQTYSLARALDTAIEKKADIVNMSFGSLIGDMLLRHLIEEGARRGVIFVAPVGNRSDQETLWFPASHRNVIAVAGTDENGNPFPNPVIASKAAVSAPAFNLFTTVPGQKHNFLSGTSMSSAVVSGLLAIAQDRSGRVIQSQLPVFNGDFCAWEEKLLKLSLCSDRKSTPE